MKKSLCVLIFSLIVLFSIGGKFDEINVHATSMEENYNVFGLGKTVNIAKDRYLNYDDINSSKVIFDTEWLNQRLESSDLIDNTNQSSNSTIVSGTSIENITLDLGLNTKFETKIDGKAYDVLNATLKSEFNIVSIETIKKYKYQFFYKYYGYYPRYYANLFKNVNESIYTENLDKTYEGYLNLLFRGAITPQVFFDKYGTHVISSGVYGGRFDYTYYALNNQKAITTDMQIKAEQGITAAISNIVNGGVGNSFDFKSAIGYDKLSVETKGEMNSRGGAPTTTTSLENFSTELNKWLPSLTNDTSALIDIPSNGLIPLWELLPPQHADKKEIFKNKCKQYLNDNTNGFSEYGLELDLGDKYCDNNFYIIREDEIKVDYNDAWKNNCDIVDLNFLTEYGFDLLKSEGYDKMKIEIQMDMREENHGYQYIYLFNNISDDTTYLVAEEKHDLGHNELVKNPRLETIIFDDISLSDFPSGCLYIKYGSSGIFQNDWFNKNLKVKITYSR